ncbi:MAG: ATPase, T2SS/T4P/T4SS family [Myxococcota bacterium]|nr:ATPase, T2SS/T4P/T4SS family [Myxococcota bacterium]
MTTIISIIEQAVKQDATDIYLLEGQLPKVKIDHKLHSLKGLKPVDSSIIRRELEDWLSDDQLETTNQNLKFVVDTAFGPLRMALFHANGLESLHIRPLPAHPKRLRGLMLPDSLGQIIDDRKGLILVAGQSGSGRSSLIRAMLLERKDSIIVTCENPVEVLIPSVDSLIVQTDVMKDGLSTTELIAQASQMNADIIVITSFDEHPDTAQAIMTAAVSSLVIVECVGNDEVDSLRRFQMLLPNGQHDIGRKMLSENISCLISTQLIPKTTGGLIPIVGITHFNQSCIDRVKLDDLEGLRILVNKGNAQPTSQYVDHILANMVRSQTLSLENALKYAVEPSVMKLRAAGIIHND